MKTKATDLRTLRLEAGFANRSEFARACGVDRVTVWRWESGRRGLSIEAASRVAKVLGVDALTVLMAVSPEWGHH